MRVLRKAVFLTVAAFVLLCELGCGDQYRPVANPIISPGGQPQTAHFAWVVNNNPSGNGSTTEIDVSGDTNLAVNSMGVGAIAEVFAANSLSLYVANKGEDTVMQYLPTLAGAITTISLPPGSHPVALTSVANQQVQVLNSGTNASCPNGGSISTINTPSLNVTNTTCIGRNPIAMAQSTSNGYVYAINQGDNSISVFNPSTNGIVGTITTQDGLGVNPVSITANSTGWIFVVTQGDGVNPGTLDAIRAGSTTIAGTAPLGVQPTFSVVDDNRARLYVTNSGDNTVSVFDTSNVMSGKDPVMTTLATVPVGTQPIGVAVLPDGTNFYVANAGSDDVTVASQHSFIPQTTVALPAGANPVFITADPTSQKVYVADQGTSQTTIIQTSNNTIALNISAPAQNPGCTSSCALQSPVMIVTK